MCSLMEIGRDHLLDTYDILSVIGPLNLGENVEMRGNANLIRMIRIQYKATTYHWSQIVFLL